MIVKKFVFVSFFLLNLFILVMGGSSKYISFPHIFIMTENLPILRGERCHQLLIVPSNGTEVKIEHSWVEPGYFALFRGRTCFPLPFDVNSKKDFENFKAMGFCFDIPLLKLKNGRKFGDCINFCRKFLGDPDVSFNGIEGYIKFFQHINSIGCKSDISCVFGVKVVIIYANHIDCYFLNWGRGEVFLKGLTKLISKNLKEEDFRKIDWIRHLSEYFDKTVISQFTFMGFEVANGGGRKDIDRIKFLLGGCGIDTFKEKDFPGKVYFLCHFILKLNMFTFLNRMVFSGGSYEKFLPLISIRRESFLKILNFLDKKYNSTRVYIANWSSCDKRYWLIPEDKVVVSLKPVKKIEGDKIISSSKGMIYYLVEKKELENFLKGNIVNGNFPDLGNILKWLESGGDEFRNLKKDKKRWICPDIT